MKIRPVMIVLLVTFAALITLEIAAFADPTTAEDLYGQGKAAFARTDYQTAIVRWNESYELSREPELLFDLAQAYRLSGDCATALKTYAEFIASAPDAEQRPLAEDLVRELGPKCTPPKKPPIEIQPRSAPGLNLVDRIDRTKYAPGSSLKITGTATAIGGVAMFAIGLAIGHHAATIGEEVSRACMTSCDWDALRSKDAAGRRDATIGLAFDAIGGGAILVGAAMYYLGIRSIGVDVRKNETTVAWSKVW